MKDIRVISVLVNSGSDFLFTHTHIYVCVSVCVCVHIYIYIGEGSGTNSQTFFVQQIYNLSSTFFLRYFVEHQLKLCWRST